MSHDVFVFQELTEGIEAARTKAERIVNKDGYDVLILQKMDPEEVADARAKARDIREIIADNNIMGMIQLRMLLLEAVSDIDYYLEPKKDLP